ncbi:hypothetical protein D3C81_1704790 [compost metagenome]
MVDKQSVTDPGTGMDLHTGHESADLGDDPRQRKPSSFVKGVGYSVGPYRVKSGIGENNLESAAGCGIVVEYSPDVRLDMLKHHVSPLLYFPASC